MESSSVHAYGITELPANLHTLKPGYILCKAGFFKVQKFYILLM